ncbi:MAG: LapA family protein [Chitinispirillaceae bacterium]|nr:LapA family protein [Chitinispirillaceae bacterium]
MRFFSWILLFIFSLFIALVLVLTFIQPEFKQMVGAQILTYKTQQMPVYSYVIGAFVLGLALGVMQALYTFIRTRAELFAKNRKIRELEHQLDEQTQHPESAQEEPQAALPPQHIEQKESTEEKEETNTTV